MGFKFFTIYDINLPFFNAFLKFAFFYDNFQHTHYTRKVGVHTDTLFFYLPVPVSSFYYDAN